MNYNTLAFFTGLFGSLHCIGMCGPLALSMPSLRSGFLLVLLDKLMYNLGRVLSYSLLGVLVGAIGNQLWLAGMQAGISVLSGILILLTAASRLLKLSLFKSGIPAKNLQGFNKLFTYALKHRAGHFTIGLLNGFLPCGFVYLAMAGALNAGSIGGSVLYMFWFGTGTIPLMLIAMVSAGMFRPVLRHKLNAAIPYLMLFLGIWFVLRGLSLNIPYLSPATATSTVECR